MNMRTHTLLHNEAAVHADKAMAVMSMPVIIGANIIAQVVAFWLSGQESLFPGTDTFMSIVSTCSQIIAGLYGTTLAGYTFFLSRIDALMASDATIDYVVRSIKNRFKYLVWYITFNVLITLAFSMLLMYIPAPVGEKVSYFYRLFCNEFVLFLGFSVAMILYYSILVINPNCIEKEAAKLKKKLCRRGTAGSATEFIALYDRIETACNSLLPANVLNQIHENKGKRFEYTIELLSEQALLLRPLIADLIRIHRYYECAINCTPLSVSEEMCVLARRVCTVVEQLSHKVAVKHSEY